MHLKSYPKVMRSELRLDATGVQMSSQRSSLFVSQQGGLLRTCSSNHGNISSRLPFSVISTNTLRCTNATYSSNSVTSLRLKLPSSTALKLLPPPGCENNTPELNQTNTEDTDCPLDIWTVIKPGHVREKIAIFASEVGQKDGPGGGERTSTSSPGSCDRAPAVCTNHTSTMVLSRAGKAKGSWEESCSAKRRRRSGNSQNQKLQPVQRTRVLDGQQQTLKLTPPHSDSPQRSGVGPCEGEEVTAEEEEEQKVSVVEMVAFLEQRVSEQQPDTKPVVSLQRSSTTITLSRAPPPEVKEGLEVSGKEPESIKVSDMVAKLESECLRRRTEGDLSRSNSLRRMVGRVLLTAGEQSSDPCQPASPSSPMAPSSSSLSGAQCQSREPISYPETATMDTPASALTTPQSGKLVAESQEAVCASGLERDSTVIEAQIVNLPLQSEEAEPLPGLLFLSPSPAETLSLTDSELCLPCHRTTCDLEPAFSQPRPPLVSDSGSQLEKKRRKAARVQDEVVGVTSCPTAVLLSRRTSASQDFLEMRMRLQQLLEPQPYLAALPDELLVKIFLLLPTQSLAALKCTCNYFKFVIEHYGVRPADSLWVSDPRYRDDPCKQCKKRYGRGDVSLCRWHHKPYCQALPYGPGYWMCCHGAHKDAHGCNVGLHDNRWVPAFHSINVPIYRRSRTHDD